jgi:hypothetical protein
MVGGVVKVASLLTPPSSLCSRQNDISGGVKGRQRGCDDGGTTSGAMMKGAVARQ